MKYFLATLITAITLTSCAQTQSSSIKIPLGSKQKTSNEAIATFSEGCFWHAEIVFQSLEGIRDAVSGYAGGTDTDPEYEKVATGRTGHAETVQIYYDPSKISFETLVKALFASMHPTQANGQGNDIGTEYRSIAFYRNEKEKQIIEAEIKRLTDAKVYKNKIVTEVVSFKNFYPAEDYHQEYIYYHPNTAYVRNVSIPEFLEFKKEFKGNFKAGQ
jgi:peptide-methionine (S)-S-oxide reductase